MCRPLNYRCSRWCADYETCTRTDCDRVALFPNGKDIKMVEREVGDPITLAIIKRNEKDKIPDFN